MQPSILIVEDDIAIRILLQAALEDEGYHVEIAEDGWLALQKIKQCVRPYDVILLDLVLPHLHGLRVLEHLLQNAQTWITSVIVQSADIQALRQVSGRGITHYLPKPFDLDTLLALISDSCAHLAIEKGA